MLRVPLKGLLFLMLLACCAVAQTPEAIGDISAGSTSENLTPEQRQKEQTFLRDEAFKSLATYTLDDGGTVPELIHGWVVEAYGNPTERADLEGRLIAVLY